MEVFFCECFAISATRNYVWDERQITTDPCDNRIIVSRAAAAAAALRLFLSCACDAAQRSLLLFCSVVPQTFKLDV